MLSDAKTGGKDLWFEEIFDFSQEDLMKDDVMLLDAGEEVFVWVGPDASENESSKAFATAAEYIKASAASLGRSKTVALTKVTILPVSFTHGALCCSIPPSLDLPWASLGRSPR